MHVGPDAVDYLAGQRLFTDELATAGYRLGLTGKWHLGANDRPRPGFVHWYAHERGGSPYRGAPMYRDGRAETVETYLTDVLADDANAFLRAELGRPESLYLSLHFTAPHKPWKHQHPSEVERLYDDCAFASCPQGARHPWVPLVDGAPIGGEPDTRAALVRWTRASLGSQLTASEPSTAVATPRSQTTISSSMFCGVSETTDTEAVTLLASSS